MRKTIFPLNLIIAVSVGWIFATSFPLHSETAPSTNLGTGKPGLKIIYKGTNQFVIYQDEPWTIGPGIQAGYDSRQIDVLFDRNYGLKEIIRNRKWDDFPEALYPFDDQRVFTCRYPEVPLYAKTFSYWPHRTQLFSMNADPILVSDDVYALARQQYELTTNQLFLGKIGTNVFYWEMGDLNKVFFKPLGQKKATKYFKLSGMRDIYGVAKSLKKDVGFTVLRKYGPGLISFLFNPYDFVEVSFSAAKTVKSDKP